MKYHYQFASKSSARIELIPENDSEKELIASFIKDESNPELTELFAKGFENYQAKARLTETVFMNFPTVALCRFQVIKETKPSTFVNSTQMQLRLDF